MPSVKTRPFVCAAEYLGDQLFDYYCRLKEQYYSATPDARPAMLADIGLYVLLADEVHDLAEALGMVEHSIVDRPPSKQDVHTALGKTLKRHAAELTISPELAAYIQRLPASERLRGESEAEALQKLSKSKANKNQRPLDVEPENMPAHYEAVAQLVQPLLGLDQVIAKAWQAVEKRSPLGHIESCLGIHSQYFYYPDTPHGIEPAMSKGQKAARGSATL
jgi:hypothetical protein